MHKEFDELCLLSHAGELSAGQRARFEEHRSGCSECAELLEALGSAARAADLAAVSLPEGRLGEIVDNVLGKARETVSREPAAGPVLGGWLLGLRRVWGASVVAAAFAVGLYVTSWEGGPRPDLSWSNGLQSDIEGLAEGIDDLSDSLEVSASGEELDSDIRALEDTTESMMRQLSGA
ncbi:hypothetical protein ACFL2T_03145 [Elusimicrobiota bacterium]